MIPLALSGVAREKRVTSTTADETRVKAGTHPVTLKNLKGPDSRPVPSRGLRVVKLSAP